ACGWTRKQLGRSAAQPIDNQSRPFAHCGVGAPQALGQRGKWPPAILDAARTPINRIGFHREASLPKHAHRPRHMISGGHQKPALAGFRRRYPLAEKGFFERVGGWALALDAARRKAEAPEQPQRRLGLVAAIEEAAVAAGKDDAGIGIAPS